jgi:hypothetical protein
MMTFNPIHKPRRFCRIHFGDTKVFGVPFQNIHRSCGAVKRFGHLSIILALALSWFAPEKGNAQATLLPLAESCFVGLSPVSGGPGGTGTGFVGLLGTITGGSGGTNGTYGGVALTGGNGTGATANITVSGGAVTAVTILNPGKQYVVGNTLSAVSATIGNVTGFSVPISSVYINQSLAGGTIAFYIPNTSTFKQTWFNADQASNHQNTNPVTLDANGCAVIYGSGIYRQVLQDSSGNTIWDQLTASTNQNNPYWANLAGGTPNAITVVDAAFAGTDGQIIGFIPLFTNTAATTINPSGFGTYSIVKDTAAGAVALTGGEIVAGSPSNVVYVSFSATQQNFHIINLVQSSQAASPVQPPQGYLTLLNAASGGPIMGASDITAATTIYYTPYVGNQIPIWNGSSFTILVFPELSLVFSASAQAANNIYDVCVFNNAGNPIAVFGPAWQTPTAGSGARGTGAGTPQLAKQSGIWVNAVQISANNGSNTYTIPALQCTYVGSVFIDAAAGQASAYRTWGSSRKFAPWNAYNRVPICLLAGDSTPSWSYTAGTVREANGGTTNTAAVFEGLAEDEIVTSYQDSISTTSTTNAAGGNFGIGWNVTNAFSGTPGVTNYSISANTLNISGSPAGVYTAPPSLGVNNVNALEQAVTPNGFTGRGTQTNMVLQACWRG